ncbi:MAG: DUF4399 domain-containing protein [Methyloligellaceae bacterium]
MRQTLVAAAAVAVALTVTGAAGAGETPSNPKAKVYFINLKDGATVTSPVLIQFGLSGMGVAPAGVEDKKNTGHHHLVIDEKIEGDELNAPLPADAKHKHFGKGQTEATIALTAGKHTLQLVLGDWSHIPHNPPVMSERITITVK